MVVFPKAKINLGLKISGKRPDGYHNIETIFYPTGFCDVMEIVECSDESESDILTVTGLKLPCGTEENMVMRAARKIREAYPIPFLRIHLHKLIPTGAGLGGGSSDAACLLRSVNRIFGLAISNSRISNIALELGSDCPFFIECLPSYASGRGEILKPVDQMLKGFVLVILNPGITVSTREAYETCIPEGSASGLAEIVSLPLSEWKSLLKNDFEKTVFKKYPIISKLKEGLYESGALYSSMSGSGSSVFGIFRQEPVIPDYLKEYTIYQGAL